MPADSPQPLLTLRPEQMRRLGYQVVDLVVDALAGLLRRRSGWEVVAPTRLALVGFRFADPSVAPEEQEAVNRRVADAMLVDDLATLSSTVLDGRTTLRLCTVNPRTTREDVEATLARVEELATTA
jgi:glutamate/tyrosine decarboxylase-like PLP-dependent enzyme